MGKFFKYLVIAIIALAFGVSTGIGYWIMSCEKYLKEKTISMDFKVNSDTGFNGLYRVLFKEEQDTPKYFWRYLVKVKKFDKKIRPGYYRAEKLSLNDVFQMVMDGKQYTIKITIPEGYNIYDITKRLQSSELQNVSDFFQQATDKKLIQTLTGVDTDRLEGFLYPDTYFFPPDITSTNIIKRMHGNFMKNIPSDFNDKMKAQGYTPYQGLIIASIVQKETYDKDEAPIVASVFLNRLKINMRLQADPTVIYGKYENFDGDIRFKDLRDTENIYNTYTHGGLTPTPICSPSKIALYAVANPADTKYLYFVADDKGKHIFSKSYREHLNYVNSYQRQRKKLD